MIGSFTEAYEALDRIDGDATQVVTAVRAFLDGRTIDENQEWDDVLADRRAAAHLSRRCDQLAGSTLRGLLS